MGCTISRIYDDRRQIPIGIQRIEYMPLRKRGVRLEVLKYVLSRLSKENEQTAQALLKRKPRSAGECVVHGFVRSHSKTSSYAEYLGANVHTARLVGHVNVFVSHAWAYPFEDTVEAIEEFEATLADNSPPCYYFLDYFAVNQNAPEKDLAKLGNIARESQKLLLIATPWHQPKTLERAWVIFELANAVIGKIELVLTMPVSEKKKFEEAVAQRLSFESGCLEFMEIFSKINSKDSKASVEDDLKNIKSFITDKLGGFGYVDWKVSDALKLWMGKTAYQFGETYTSEGTEEHALFLLGSNWLCGSLGMSDCMLKCSEQVLRIYEEIGNTGQVVDAMGKVSFAFQNFGRFSEEIKLWEKWLESTIKKYGPEHDRVAMTRYYLSESYLRTKLWAQAETQIRLALTYWKYNNKKQQPVNEERRTALKSLAVILRDSGKDLDEATKLFKWMLDWETAQFGKQNPTVLLTAAHHARCLQLKANLTALQTWEKAYPTLLETYGKNHRDVMDVFCWMNAARTDKKKEE